LHEGEFCLQSHGEINVPRWHSNFEFIAIALEPSFVERSFLDAGVDGGAFIEQRGFFRN
jgi:AraC family transcriptional regulator